MPFEIVCGTCNFIIYSGFDLKAVKDALRSSDGKCRKCGSKLSMTDFALDVLKVQGS